MTTPVYTTLTDLKGLLPSNNFGTSLDALLTDMIITASREIDGFLRRPPGSFAVNADTTRYFDGSGKRTLWIGELAAIPTTVSMAETGTVDNAAGTGGTYTLMTTNDYWLWPDNSTLEGKPYMRLDLNVLNGTKAIWYRFPRAIKVLGKFGFSTSTNMPDEIVKATKIQVMRYFKRSQQAFADTGAIKELNQMTYVKKLDPDVENIIKLPKFAQGDWL